MAGDVVKFIRKNGRIIPIRASNGVRAVGGAMAAGGAAVVAHDKLKGKKSPKIKVNRALDITGFGLSVASGALAAATFSGGTKGFLAGHAIAHGIDIGGIAANVASVAGKGKTKDRAKQAAKQEARNFVVGNAVYALGVLGFKKNRQAAVGYAKKGVEYAGKILAFARKGLRV